MLATVLLDSAVIDGLWLFLSKCIEEKGKEMKGKEMKGREGKGKKGKDMKGKEHSIVPKCHSAQRL